MVKKQQPKSDLRIVIDHFVKEMSGVNDKRIDTIRKDLHFCMKEAELFNELRQNLLLLDTNQLDLESAE